MFPKCVLLLFLIESVLQLTHGEDDDKFFRNDYTYIKNTESFYKVHTIGKTWNSAKIQCEREGATLFYPDDELEVAEVINYWNQTQPYMNWIFIGIAALNVQEVFETVDGKQLWDVFNNWMYGEPNNAGGEEGCVVLNKESTFNDDKCEKKFPFICKKSLGSLQWNKKCHIPDQSYTINEMQDKCYKFHLRPMNWTDAYAICNSEQSYLAIINSDFEAAYLVNITANAPKDNIKGNYLRGAVHLGFKKTNAGEWITAKVRGRVVNLMIRNKFAAINVWNGVSRAINKNRIEYDRLTLVYIDPSFNIVWKPTKTPCLLESFTNENNTKCVPMHESGYNNWGYAQPDGDTTENCGSMFYNGELNDIACNQRMFFICEHEVALRFQDITLKFGTDKIGRD